jgi:hypothetical protein
MIANAKNFKTLTLRGLDEKPDIVATMNEAMQYVPSHTGQAVIEYIITDYARKCREVQRLRTSILAETEAHEAYQKDIEFRYEDAISTLRNLKNAFQLIQNTLDK